MLHAIKSNFATDDVITKRSDLYKVNVVKERVFELIRFIGENYDYQVLNAITCTDWIEDGHFALTYIITTTDRKSTFMVQTEINREESHIDSFSKEFPQAEIFERDLHEMYGIDFIGNENLKELSLENWVHTPPLRREFDTLEFVNNNLTFREGREDNMDVKKEAKRIRTEKKAAKEAAKKLEEEKKAQTEETSDGK
ncbi:MAG: NADH-quinone oxidoreductase subunit C [Campylobacterota bacterium]|nr:NADH-quinone oxidoreductase subunit C [Campylobacterota bacterium]